MKLRSVRGLTPLFPGRPTLRVSSPSDVWCRGLTCIGLLVASLLGFAPSPCHAAATIENVTAELGWQGAVRLGRWNQATVTFELSEPAQLSLECRALDPEGHTARYSNGWQACQPGLVRLKMPFQLGRINAPLELHLIHAGEPNTTLWQATYRPQTDGGWTPLVLSDRLVITTSRLRDLGELATPVGTPGRSGLRLIELDSVDALPRESAAYQAVDWLCLAGPPPTDPTFRATLATWVKSGGRLFVSLPAARDQWTAATEWLPVTLGPEPAVIRELTSMEAFAGRNLRLPYTGRLEVPRLVKPDGITHAASREDPLLVQIPWGLGEVVVLTMDVTAAPLGKWDALPQFLQQVWALDRRETLSKESTQSGPLGPLTSTGISDLASQLQATQEYFPEIARPAPWWTMGWMLALLVLVGPLDYLLTHYVFRRPRWTWTTLVIWSMGLAAYAASSATTWNGTAIRRNTLDVIDYDATSGQLRGQTWVTDYAPRTSRLQSTWIPKTAAWGGATPPLPQTERLYGWSSFPETGTGGLYRPGGSEWGRTDYRVDMRDGTIHDLPTLQWSTRTLTGTWTEQTPGLLESRLENSGLGRLTGELTHHLPGTLYDWMLAYGGRVYQLHPSRTSAEVVPLEPNVTLSTDNPLLLQGDLRGLLTRTITTQEVGAKKETERRIVQEQTRYDPTDRDPLRLWQVITFHRAAGGREYTGLSNDALFDHDLSRQLELGHAVLFGRLVGPPEAAASVIESMPRLEQAGRTDVYMRLVIPVKRGDEVVRALPKFKKD